MAEKNNRINDNDGSASNSDSNLLQSGGQVFEIHVKGQLDRCWSAWLDGLEMKLLEGGEMLLFGPIVDQAALMGVLNKLNRLNLSLISVNGLKKNNRSEEK